MSHPPPPGPVIGRIISVLALTLLLTSVFAAGLIYRQRTGIGFEGAAILVIYVVGFVALAAMGGVGSGGASGP